MGKKIKVLVTKTAYYEDHLRSEGSIIMFDMDHCGTEEVDGKVVQKTELPKWAVYAKVDAEEREGGEEIEQPKETTLNELTTKSGPKLSKPSKPSTKGKDANK